MSDALRVLPGRERLDGALERVHGDGEPVDALVAGFPMDDDQSTSLVPK